MDFLALNKKLTNRRMRARNTILAIRNYCPFYGGHDRQRSTSHD